MLISHLSVLLCILYSIKMVRWLLHKVAQWVAEYPKLSLGLVIAYVFASFFELIPVIEILSDFCVILVYVSIRRYIARRRALGQPLN
jgi:hypothetical protein